MLQVIIGLVVVICLALLFQMMGFVEGYENKATRYSDLKASPDIDLLLRKIYYFSGKKISGVIPLAGLIPIDSRPLENKINNWITTGKIGDESKTEVDTIDIVENELMIATDSKNSTGFYNLHKSSVTPSTEAPDEAAANNPINIYQVIQYFNKLGFLTNAQLSEVNAMAAKRSNDMNDAIIARLKSSVGSAKYEEFISIYNDLEYFKKKGIITDIYATQIYNLLYREKTTTNALIALKRDISNYAVVHAKANNSTNSSFTNTPSYNANVSNVKYHDDPSKLSDPQRDIMIKGPDGKMIKWSDAVKIDARYNNSGYSRYSPTNYVPEYEDSIFLSRFSSYTAKAPVVDYGFGLGPDKSGFCKASESNPSETDIKCNKLDANTCAATSCWSQTKRRWG